MNMNKLLPILLIVCLAIIPELCFAYDRDSYEGYIPRSGGSGKSSWIGGALSAIIFFLAWAYAAFWLFVTMIDNKVPAWIALAIVFVGSIWALTFLRDSGIITL